MLRLAALWIALAGFGLLGEQSRAQVAQDPELSIIFERLPSSLATGEHGTATLDALIGPDGSASDIRLEISSRSDMLDADAIALAADYKFALQRDASGRPVAVRRKIEIDFNGAWPAADNLPYLCSQLNKDQDWWAAHWPSDKKDGYEIKLSGFHLILESLQRKPLNSFDDIWPVLKGRCRSQPDRRALDIFRELILKTPEKQ